MDYTISKMSILLVTVWLLTGGSILALAVSKYVMTHSYIKIIPLPYLTLVVFQNQWFIVVPALAFSIVTLFPWSNKDKVSQYKTAFGIVCVACMWLIGFVVTVACLLPWVPRRMS